MFYNKYKLGNDIINKIDIYSEISVDFVEIQLYINDHYKNTYYSDKKYRVNDCYVYVINLLNPIYRCAFFNETFNIKTNIIVKNINIYYQQLDLHTISKIQKSITVDLTSGDQFQNGKCNIFKYTMQPYDTLIIINGNLKQII